MDLTFKGFLDKISTPKKTYGCETNEIIVSVGENETIIATRVPVIVCPNMEAEDDVIRFEGVIALNENEDRRQQLEVFVNSLKPGDIDLDREEVEEIVDGLYKSKWIKDKNELVSLYFRFIKYYIKGYLENNYSILARCGWKKAGDGKEFYSVTKREGGDFAYIQDMFGWDVYRMFRKKEDFSQILTKFNQCKEFYDFLFANPVLIGVFAYTIHALTMDYLCLYDKRNYELYTNNAENQDAVFFSICIHGKDVDKAKVIANIFCNLFNEPKGSWTKVSTVHHISATSINTSAGKLRKYSSVPIIVTSKTNHIMKSSKIVKELYGNRKDMKLFIYPVYVNDTPINVDEMVNFNIDRVELPFPVKNAEQAQKIHSQLAMLLFSLVSYLRDKSMGRSLHNNQENTEEEFEQEWVEEHVPEYLLYLALKKFCDFIKAFQVEEGEKLLAAYRNSIMNTDETEDAEQQIQTVSSDTEQRQRYLLCLHKLIADSLRRKEDWLWEGNESRGEKERCYYLDVNIWHEKFSERLEKDKMEAIGKHEIAAYLKEYQLLKRQKSSSANTMCRHKKNCYVILADVFDNKVNQWNTPTE